MLCSEASIYLGWRYTCRKCADSYNHGVGEAKTKPKLMRPQASPNSRKTDDLNFCLTRRCPRFFTLATCMCLAGQDGHHLQSNRRPGHAIRQAYGRQMHSAAKVPHFTTARCQTMFTENGRWWAIKDSEFLPSENALADSYNGWMKKASGMIPTTLWQACT